MSLAGLEEYIFTAGLSFAFIAMIVSMVIGRKHFAFVLRDSGIDLEKIAVAVFILAIFVSVGIVFVKPTQQLFFDDAIYQAGAISLLRSGQTWMCNFGSQAVCYSGQIYHEPIGTSFNIAIAFALGGISRASAYNLEFILGGIAVIMTFLITIVLTRDFIAASFAELLMALSPALLIWSRPTTSDMPMLAYSLVAIFMMLVFMRRKNLITLSAASFSMVVLSYMKVDALAYILVIPAMYVVLDGSSIRNSISINFARLKKYAIDTKPLILILLIVLAIMPEAVYTANEAVSGSYGYQNTYVQETCAAPGSANSVMNPTGKIDLQNFEANSCANVEFWFNAFSSEYIVQPIAFTAIALVGAGLMMLYDRRMLLAIGGWFLVFFILYTSFYAGGVIYGVDWRFMLSLIAQASILGGYGASKVIEKFRV